MRLKRLFNDRLSFSDVALSSNLRSLYIEMKRSDSSGRICWSLSNRDEQLLCRLLEDVQIRDMLGWRMEASMRRVVVEGRVSTIKLMTDSLTCRFDGRGRVIIDNWLIRRLEDAVVHHQYEIIEYILSKGCWTYLFYRLLIGVIKRNDAEMTKWWLDRVNYTPQELESLVSMATEDNCLEMVALLTERSRSHT